MVAWQQITTGMLGMCVLGTLRIPCRPADTYHIASRHPFETGVVPAEVNILQPPCCFDLTINRYHRNLSYPFERQSIYGILIGLVFSRLED